MAEPIQNQNISKMTSLTNKERDEIKRVIAESLQADGISPDEIPLHSQAGIMTQYFLSKFDIAVSTVQNISRESSLLHARSLQSLYSLLIQHTDEISLCTPSSIDLFVKIPIDFVLSYGKLITDVNTYEFIYSNKNSVVLDGLEFRCKYDKVYIRVYGEGDLKEIRVFTRDAYDVETNLISHRLIDSNSNIAYLLFEAPFLQITYEELEFPFTDTQYEKFVVETKRPINTFSLEYVAPSGKIKPITPKLYFTRTTGDYLEYEYRSNKSITINHVYMHGGFKPEEAGILRVKLVTTQGRDIKFKGNPKTSDGRLFPTNLIVDYLPVENDHYESSGGKLATDHIEAIRNLIIKYKSTRRRIDTEDDMYTYLLNYGGSSIFKPIMTINNVKSRIFSIFTILSFTEKLAEHASRTFTVPTDSADVIVNTATLPTEVDKMGRNYYCITSKNTIKSQQDTFSSDYTLGVDDGPPGTGKILFNFISPFIHSYCKETNMMRSFMDLCDDVPYRLFPTYETSRSDTETRFAATNLRINSRKEDTGEEFYTVTCQIRADNTNCKLLENDKFKAYLEFVDPNDDNKRKVYIGTKSVVDIEDNNKYDITFDVTTDKLIYGDRINISYKDEKNASQTLSVNVNTPMKVILKLRDRIVDGSSYLDTYSTITEFNCETFSFFEEVTKHLVVQTTTNNTGYLKIVALPMILKGFYDKKYLNRLNIYKEIKNIVNFLNTDLYNDLDQFSKRSYNLRDVQETLFNVAIKFVKSVGVSKKLEVGSDAKYTLTNLQLKPKLFVRRKSKDFDLKVVSDTLNNKMITHNFLNDDLHMISVISDILDNNTENLSILQFVNFDSYQPDAHMINQKTFDISSIETPEVLSIGFDYDEKLKIYNYNIEYREI